MSDREVGCEVARAWLPRGHETVEGTVARCGRCGHWTESFGVIERSVRRCLALMREQCPFEEDNYYDREAQVDEKASRVLRGTSLKHGAYDLRLASVTEHGRSWIWVWEAMPGGQKVRMWTSFEDDELWKLSEIFRALGADPSTDTDLLLGEYASVVAWPGGRFTFRPAA